jgi:hypothetical protein
MSDRNGGTNENENRKRLDHMEDVIQSMITLTLEAGQDVRPAARAEHRIDIMALFESQKYLREGGQKE